jgi:uncharacterized protein YdeI (YjbR/CyaY-like superfamily)
MKELNELYFTSRNEWRQWLKKNHSKYTGIWFIYYKDHTGKPSIPYEDSVEEALCFGWIDSIIKKIDDDRYARKFTIRKNDSKWSELNKRRVNKLIKSGLMTEAGMQKINAAKSSGNWEKVIRIPPFEDPPPEFQAALEKNDLARNNFFNLANSYRRQYIGWISTAKKEETRNKRLIEAIKLLEKNQKLGLR